MRGEEIVAALDRVGRTGVSEVPRDGLAQDDVEPRSDDDARSNKCLRVRHLIARREMP